MKARAVVMRRTGGPEVLVLEDVELAPLGPGEIRIRALASAINYSDLQIRAGHWNIRRAAKFPYVPGLEVIGDIVEVGADAAGLRVGQRVWTMMQGLGGVRAERDGGYAELVTVAATNVAPLPGELDPVAFASIGLAGVTAHQALAKLGPLEGRTVIVTGATGGVGAAAIAIARAAGAQVEPLHRHSPPPAAGSADAVLDVVAGPLFPALVRSLRRHGSYCVVGAVAGGDVTFDVWDLLGGLTLTGYSTEDLDDEQLRDATRALLALELPAAPHLVMPLAQASRAHELLERRDVSGRIILVPGAS